MQSRAHVAPKYRPLTSLSEDETMTDSTDEEDDAVVGLRDIKDRLGKRLENRRSRSDLMAVNILKGDLVAPNLHARSIEFEKARKEDRLNRKLQMRPSREELVAQNIMKTGDPLIATSKDSVKRALIERTLKAQLQQKYGKIFAGPSEAAPLVEAWGRRRSLDISGITAVRRVSDVSGGIPMRRHSNVSGPAPMPGSLLPFLSIQQPTDDSKRRLSIESRTAKSEFILGLNEEGAFVCHNCCSEDFQGIEFGGSKYTYDDFFSEKDWEDLGNPVAEHNEKAKAANLCNTCFGVCSCGREHGGFACDTCGSLPPITCSQVRRAPQYPRARFREDITDRREKQLQRATEADRMSHNHTRGRLRARSVSYYRPSSSTPSTSSAPPVPTIPPPAVSQEPATPSATPTVPSIVLPGDELSVTLNGGADDTASPVASEWEFERYRFMNAFEDYVMLYAAPCDEEDDDGALYIDGDEWPVPFDSTSSSRFFFVRSESGDRFALARGSAADAASVSDVRAMKANQTRVFLVDKGSDSVYYYPDKKVGEFFAWDRRTNSITQVS